MQLGGGGGGTHMVAPRTGSRLNYVSNIYTDKTHSTCSRIHVVKEVAVDLGHGYRNQFTLRVRRMTFFVQKLLFLFKKDFFCAGITFLCDS